MKNNYLSFLCCMYTSSIYTIYYDTLLPYSSIQIYLNNINLY